LILGGPFFRILFMTTRIDSTFARLRANGQAGLVSYLTGGDPDLPTSFSLCSGLVEAGTDILEIGVPFSDPLADGPTIQAAAGRALAAGANLPLLLEHLAEWRKSHPDPAVVLFTYLNPVYMFGFEKFHEAAATAGADGVLFLDLPPDEARRNEELAKAHGLQPIRLIAPTTPEERIREICATAGGFIYYVSREGVTGEQQTLSGSIEERVELIRKHTDLPICVGFGISTPAQATEVAQQADGVVVGSAIVRRIAENAGQPDLVPRLVDFVRPLADAVHGAQAPV
jgi:tryptophan synthase alpha chain